MVSLQDRKRVSSDLKSWLDDVKKYERTYSKWEARVEKILKKYRDEGRMASSQDGYTMAKFNILWSNVQTLVPAVYSRVPQPDVSRRYRDQDPIGRIASLILERALDYEVSHYPFYRDSMKMAVMDRFLGGRGTTWIRYEPHIRVQDPENEIQDDEFVTDNSESETLEEIEYECTPVDYVHWRDYGNNVSRTEPEVTRKWRKVYMTREGLVERFGEDIAKIIPLDATPDEMKNQPDYMPDSGGDRACVYEGWDKTNREVVWFSKSVKDFLDRKPDPLMLEQFFPCPVPLYATLTNESLVPVPDFTLYQDQANELDILCDRIDGLTKALKVTGVYDASQGPTIARLFTESENNSLFPVKNWAAFAEKNGLKGAIDVVDLTPIAKALNEAYTAMEQIKGQIYEITGISDIIRGQSVASETATAQQLKGQYATLRLKSMQTEVSRFATDILQIMAEIICSKYQPQTLLQISAADQLTIVDTDVMALGVPAPMVQQIPPEQKKQMVLDAAVQMLKNEPLRNFRIDIAADSMVQIDEQADKEARIDFLKAVGGFFDKIVPAATAAPQALPLLLKLLQFGVRGFKVGKSIEGEFNDLVAKLTIEPPKPPEPQADPKLEAEKFRAQAEKEKAGLDVQVAREKAGIERERMAAERQNDMAQLAIEGERLQMQRANVVPIGMA